ncbi:L-aspartate oxidase [Celerinatantimonas diazotrophica]|nr:L-aspartate oxidase [Celerinatantimonas diazotrophica]
MYTHKIMPTRILVIGAGIAALSLAAHANDDCEVIILTKTTPADSNSMLAQGGIASAYLPDDSVQQHLQDTLEAGAGHNDAIASEAIIREGKAIVLNLLKHGCPFDRSPSQQPYLGKEGAHSQNRIFHAGGDQTGRILVQYLIQQLPKNIQFIESAQVLELIKSADHQRCIGVVYKNSLGELISIKADAVVLATGGCGQLYPVTTNNKTLTGDGLMMAYRAGVKLVDLEFIQFHPTLLINHHRVFGLVSEAVRGQGAILEDEHGRAVMAGIHPMADLAPRDVVARALQREALNGHQIYLNIRPVQHFRDHFPTISKLCDQAQVNLDEGKIPVAPGMHFLMGGIAVDDNAQSSLPGLYAIGEVACTGLHGANRLASNSLLEGLVTGKRVAMALGTCQIANSPTAELSPSLQIEVPNLSLPTLQNWLNEALAIERNAAGLIALSKKLEQLHCQITHYADASPEQIEIANAYALAKLMTQSALLRDESRGSHYRTDSPQRCDKWQGQQIVHQRGRISIVENPRILNSCTTSNFAHC